MSKRILIIGGKPIELKDKEILRKYENICRINLNMKYKDPESRDIFYVNNHVNSNMVKSRIDPRQLKNTIYKYIDYKQT